MNEVCYNKFLSLGIHEAWAKIMATQPEEANLRKGNFTDVQDAVVFFAPWYETHQGARFWCYVGRDTAHAFSMSPEEFMKEVFL